MEGKEAAARVSRIAFASQSLFSKDAAKISINKKYEFIANSLITHVSRIAFASQSLFSKDAADTNINACILQCQAISLAFSY